MATMVMTVLAEIKEKLNKHPTIFYEETETSIAVPPADSRGFEVAVHKSGSGHIVSFDGWHEEFANAADAIECFGFGLTNRCRLKIEQRGDRPYRWTLQYLEHETWKDGSVIGLFAFKFWRQTSVHYLQNQHIVFHR